MTDTPARSAAEYCAETVRRQDSDRYLLALLQPIGMRRTAMALAAWNLELAAARQRSGETTIGLMRLQWHRDALAEISAGTPRRHPVIEELAAGVATGGLDVARLETIVDARERDLDPAPPATLDELEAYARSTAGALNAALWPALPHAEDAGAAFALVGLARAEAVNQARGRPWAPKALGGDLRAVVERGADLGRRALEIGGPAAMPAALARAYAKRAAAAEFDPTAPQMAAPDPWRLWRLLAFRYLGK